MRTMRPPEWAHERPGRMTMKTLETERVFLNRFGVVIGFGSAEDMEAVEGAVEGGDAGMFIVVVFDADARAVEVA